MQKNFNDTGKGDLLIHDDLYILQDRDCELNSVQMLNDLDHWRMPVDPNQLKYHTIDMENETVIVHTY